MQKKTSTNFFVPLFKSFETTLPKRVVTVLATFFLVFNQVIIPVGTADSINQSPVAQTVRDEQNVFVGNVVTLDGTPSYHPGNSSSSLTYSWNVPAGLNLSHDPLFNPNSVVTQFTAPDNQGAFTFELIVSDGELQSNTFVNINIHPSPDSGCVAATSNPSTVFTNRGSLPAPSGFEMSGIVYHPRFDKLYFVDDGGNLGRINMDGTETRTWPLPGDLEGITIADPNSNFIYVVVESYVPSCGNGAGIVEVRLDDNGSMVNTARIFCIPTSHIPGSNNSGAEALTFVPIEGNPEGGVFYVGHQGSNRIFMYQLSIKTSSTATTVTPWGSPNYFSHANNIAGLHYEADDDTLYALYDNNSNGFLRATDLHGNYKGGNWTLPENNWEGIVMVGSKIYLTKDTGSAQPITVFDFLGCTLGQTTTINHLTTQAQGAGSISVNPQRDSYPLDMDIEVVAVPATGHIFESWGTDLSSSSNPEFLTFDQSHTITANLTPENLDVRTAAVFSSADTFISQSSPSENYGNNSAIRAVGGSNPKHMLMKWDLAEIANHIPENHHARVKTAYLTVGVFDDTKGQAYHLYEMKHAWNENTLTWNSLSADSAGSVILGTLKPSGMSRYSILLNEPANQLIESWISDASLNNGFIIKNDFSFNEFAFDSKESSTLQNRPKLTITYEIHPDNQPPIVDAGEDIAVTLPINSVTLNGSVQDDQLPNPPGVAVIQWTQAGGPGTVVFSSPNTAVTQAVFSGEGDYMLRLTADDGQYSVSDDVIVTVNPAPPPVTFTISASAGANGSISPNGEISVNSGEDQTFTITPNSGYHIADVLVDSISVGAVLSYAFSNVTANHVIEAVFQPITYSLEITTFGSGVVIKNPDLPSYPAGTQVTLTATPNRGSLFHSWSGGASGTNSTVTITMDGNKNVTARFRALLAALGFGGASGSL